MKFVGENVIFTDADTHFIKKYGLLYGADLAEHFIKTYKHPLITDTYQLSEFLGIRRKLLFDILKNKNYYYEEIKIPKKDGSFRTLNAPFGYIKFMQRKILDDIMPGYTVSRFARAYIKNISLYDNASPHIKRKFLLKIDITDFFGSINFAKIMSIVFNSNHFPKQIGYLLTDICTFNDVLPQGAPTSPAISNIVMRHFDEKFGLWCEKNGFSYTRYSDDITVSGDKSLYGAYLKAKDMLKNEGFILNEKKTHFVSNAKRQTVTGLVVNDDVSVPRDYKRKLRQELYYVFKFGAQDAVLKSDYLLYGGNDALRYLNYLLGKINFVLSIEPDNDYFLKSKENILELLTFYI